MLDLGCGGHKTPGAIGLDIAGSPDVLADLREPLPFRANSFRIVTAHQVFEHVRSEFQYDLWNEVHRVLVPFGIFIGDVPGIDLNMDWAVRDPTHVSYWSAGTLAYFVNPPEDELGAQGFAAGRTATWRIVEAALVGGETADQCWAYRWKLEALK